MLFTDGYWVRYSIIINPDSMQFDIEIRALATQSAHIRRRASTACCVGSVRHPSVNGDKMGRALIVPMAAVATIVGLWNSRTAASGQFPS